MQTSVVYLLHFNRPLGSERHQAQHYLGSAEDVDARLSEHMAGRGARLTQVANERGISYEVVRVWKAETGQGRQLERKLKKRKDGPSLCPICRNERKRQRWQLSFDDYLLVLALDFTLDELSELAF